MPGITILNSLSPPLRFPSSSKYPNNIPDYSHPRRTHDSPHHGVDPAMQNGQPPPAQTTTASSASISDIKQNAKDQVDREVKGFSAISMLRTAKTQYQHGRELDIGGNLPAALTAYAKVARLVALTMSSTEYNAEKHNGKKGVLGRELEEFVSQTGKDLGERIRMVEEKIRAMEKANPPPETNGTGPISKPGGSIADRVRSLQESAGTNIVTTKRLSVSRPSRPELPSVPTSPPAAPSSRGPLPQPPLNLNLKLDNSSIPPSKPSPHLPQTPIFPSSITAASASNSVPPSPHPTQGNSNNSNGHTFVAPSSLGPPSPSSSPSSSPQLTNFNINLSEFAQTFPSIDELDAQLSGEAGVGSDKQQAKPVQPIPTGSSVRSNRSLHKMTSSISISSALGGAGGERGPLPLPGQPVASHHPLPSVPAIAQSQSQSQPHAPPIPQSTPLSPTLLSHPQPSSPPMTRPGINGHNNSNNSNNSSNNGGSPHRPFAVPLGMSLDRPSSTPIPITPISNAFESRTPSPTLKQSTSTRPLRPSGLSAAANGTVQMDGDDGFIQQMQSSSQPQQAEESRESEVELPGPSNMITPRDLHSYMRGGRRRVLLLDVRTRMEYEQERIRADAVVCIEPSVLARERVTSESIEDSLLIAPSAEHSLFSSRDQFDLVAIYDSDSTLYSVSGPTVPSYTSPSVAALHANSPGGATGNPAIGTLVQAIYEQSFRKMLKRMPVMIVGGLEAWKKEIGEAGIMRGSGAGVNGNAGAVGSSSGVTPQQQSQIQQPTRARAETESRPPKPHGPHGPTNAHHNQVLGEHRSHLSLDQGGGHARAPAESSTSYTSSAAAPSTSNGTAMNGVGSPPPLLRKPAVSKAPNLATRTSSIDSYGSMMPSSPTTSTGMVNGHSGGGGITYPSFSRRISAQPSSSGSLYTPPTPTTSTNPYDTIVSPPPIAATLPSSLHRRNSRGFDQFPSSSTSPASSSSLRPTTIIEYPQVLQRPPPAASSPLVSERQDNRPRQPAYTPPTPGINGNHRGVLGAPVPPRIQSDYPVTYWPDTQIATSGLKNLGNTCYMNATIQCLSATVPFARFFTEGRWKNAINYTNPLGTKGQVALAFAKILHELWHGELPYITPFEFRKSMGHQKQQYGSSDQQDSQEFLTFLLDGIHEDLNRVISKPTFSRSPGQEAELEVLLPQIASDQEWQLWQTRNDSIIVDFFQGQFRNRLRCLTCGQTSTTYNAFSLLQLPIPSARSSKVPLQKCFEAYCNTEIMEKDDAWDCPKCKSKRKATKELSLSRLPPVLIIHLKRFENNGRFSDKIDTFVDFPLKSLDLTSFMPGPMPSGADKSRMVMSPTDPRTQMPPYKYDLYGVTNHYGNLSSGHYTAFIASRGGWMYCDDSSVKPTDAKSVVNQKAYVLFYKRTRA